jgi:hypothetical protein
VKKNENSPTKKRLNARKYDKRLKNSRKKKTKKTKNVKNKKVKFRQNRLISNGKRQKNVKKRQKIKPLSKFEVAKTLYSILKAFSFQLLVF